MKIVFTGVSSFTGVWFVRALAEAGHQVTCPLRRTPEQYEDTRRQRLDLLPSSVTLVPNCPFGTEEFLQLVNSESWDLLCHHGADVTNYKSPDFDAVAALENNTRGISKVLKQLKQGGARGVVLTGSVFEQDEGKGTEPLRAFSPYGLSKGLTAQVFRYYTEQAGLSLGKFVIPNPFGPFEEFRFTSYLAKNWLAGDCPTVSMPDYVRDNVPVTLLAHAYCQFVESLPEEAAMTCVRPSYFAGSQGEFTQRFAEALRPRLGLPCDFALGTQTDFSEPLERVNTDPIDTKALQWNEDEFWDALAGFYSENFQVVTS